MNVFAQARSNLNLTPSQRALLKLVEGCIVAGIVAALPIISQALTAQSINWTPVLRAAAATFSVAVLLALTKYLKAQNDAPLSTAATAIAQAAVTNIPRWAGIPTYDVVPITAGAAHGAGTTGAPAATMPAETYVLAPAAAS